MARFRHRKPVVEAPEPDPLSPVPARFNFTRDVVEAAASSDAFRPAMTFVDREGIIDRRTYKEVANDASRWTALFRSRGLEPGDRIVILVGRTPLWHSVVLGALKGGFVAVPCPETFDADELMDRSAHCDARAVVTDRAHAPSVAEAEAGTDEATAETARETVLVVEDLKEELRGHSVAEPTHDTASDDPALILYTQGATGPPKGAIHTHASTWMMRLQAEHWLDARADDLVWCTADTGSALFVWNALIGPWSLGSEIALHEKVFTVEERVDLIDRLGVTVLCQPPSEYRCIAEHLGLEEFFLGRVRHAVSTGAPLDSEIVDVFQAAFGVTIYDGYGQTESSIVVASRRHAETGIGSLGSPIPDYDIVVVDEDGNEQDVGVRGEIALRGRPPSLFAGYWNDPDGTAAVFLGDTYLTGDQATRDADGCFWFAGRSDGTLSGRRVASAATSADATSAEPVRHDEAEIELRPEIEPSAEEGRRREEEQAAAAAAAVAAATAAADERAPRDAEVGTADSPPTLEPASAKRSRREAAAARRAEKAEAKAVERQVKADEKRRREEEQADAEQQRRDDAAAEAERAAETRALEAEHKRALDEKRLAEEARAAADLAAETRALEAEHKRALDEKRLAEEARAAADLAAETRALEAEHKRALDEKRLDEEARAAADQARREEAEAQHASRAAAARQEEESRQPPATVNSDPATTADAADEHTTADIIARLRAYGHGDSSEDAMKDQDVNR